MLILGGINPEKEIEAVLQCNKAVLILEYKHDQDNQMAVFLIVEKNDQSITFRFPARKVQVKENGQTITKVIQSGLSAFVMTIEGYLTGIGADLHLSKLHDDFESSQDEDQQAYDTTVNYGYEQENYGSYGSL
jgi:hypothetical protein